MSESKAKEHRQELRDLLYQLGCDKAAVQDSDKIPTLGCPNCKDFAWYLVLNDITPKSEEVVSIVCHSCNHFIRFTVNLKAARGLVPVDDSEGKDRVV